MAWSITAKILESCSCAALCPCTLGPAKPDQGWCSGAFGIRVLQGTSDGVDLSGARLAMQFELPGDFLGGIDKAKLYLDPSLTTAQRRELDAIFHGEKGGLWGGMRGMIKTWLPSSVAKVEISDGDSPTVTVEGFGNIALQPIKTENGKPTRLVDAPILSAFGMVEEELAFAKGTKFSDPDLRRWESLGQGGTVHKVEWAA
jgi:hypothetical protein